MNQLIAKTFENRGYSTEFLLDMNNSLHKPLMDIDAMCQELHYIKTNGLNITVLPDFDTDGIMSGVIGLAGLAELGFNVSLFIPDTSEGYGFDERTIDKLMSNYPNTQAIISCDVGITCHSGIKRAKDLGLKVLITDHHIEKEKCEGDVVVNPMRCDETYEHPFICGAYVFYQVLKRYAQLYANAFAVEQIRRLRVFAGIGTVSDIMPVLYENRKLLKDSICISRLMYSNGNSIIIKHMIGNEIYRRAFYGLHCFYKMLASYGKISDTKSIDEDLYGFYVAPIFNSVKRMDGDMSRAFGVFFGGSPSEDAEYLYNLNIKRKSAVDQYMTDLFTHKQPYAPLVYITDAPKGILGLIANSILNRDEKPVIVVNVDGDIISGSGRSPEWFPFMSTAVECGFEAAGHNAAFGIHFNGVEELERFINIITERIESTLETVSLTPFKPDFVISVDSKGDTGIDIDLFDDYLYEIDYYKPFGKSFPAPCIKLTFEAKSATVFTLGSNKQHVKFSLPYGFDVLCWNQAERLSEFSNAHSFEILGHLSKNEYNDLTTMQFIGDSIICA